MAAREKLRSAATLRKTRSSVSSTAQFPPISADNLRRIIIILTISSPVASTGGTTMGENRVLIFDTTLRDGEQAPGFSLRPAEKLQLARQLDALGVDIIEAGFPIASPADAEAVRTIASEIRRPVIACLARCHTADLERAAWALEPAEQGRIHTFIATSDLHLQAKLRMTREQCLETAVESVRFARQHTADVEFSAEDA